MRTTHLARSPRRPALACALATVAGVVACHSGQFVGSLAAFLVAILVLLLVVRIDLGGLLFLLAFALLGWCRCQLAQSPWSSTDLRLHPDSRGQIILYGRTEGEAEARPNETRWILRADSVAYPDSVAPRSGRLLARFRFDPGIPPDCVVRLAGRIVPSPPARNPGDFSWSEYLRRKGLHGQFEPASGSAVLKIEPEAGWRSGFVAPLRRALKNRLVAHLDGEEAALAAGLLLGEREQLSRPTIDAFRRTGTLHLLAVSGSNVGIVAGAVWGLLLFLRVPRWARLVVSAACIALFCDLAHLEPSVVRAGAAALIVLGALALRRPVDPLQVWGLALLAFVLWEPSSILDVGCQLSFAATLGILLLPDGFRAGHGSIARRILHVVTASILVSSAAQLATLPTMLAVFHEVPLVTPLANLFSVPLAGLATLSAMLQLILAPLGEPVLAVTSAVFWVCIRGLLLAVHTADRLAIPILAVPRPGVLSMLLLGAGVLSTFAFANRPRVRRRVVILALLAACGATLAALPDSEPEVLVMDAQGPTALVRLSESETWMVGPVAGRSQELARKAALHLGWHLPDSSILLQDSVQSPARTARSAGPYRAAAAAPPGGNRPSLTVLCRSEDSRPIGVVIAHLGREVVICQTWPDEAPDRLGVGPDAIWISDGAPLHSGNGRPGDRFIVTGRSPAREEPLELHDVQVLHTRRHGSIRIYWRDRGFQTEPRVR